MYTYTTSAQNQFDFFILPWSIIIICSLCSLLLESFILSWKRPMIIYIRIFHFSVKKYINLSIKIKLILTNANIVYLFVSGLCSVYWKFRNLYLLNIGVKLLLLIFIVIVGICQHTKNINFIWVIVLYNNENRTIKD